MTTNDSIEETSRCPLCESNVNTLSLAKIGLSIEELANLKEYVKAGKMKDLLNIAGIAMRWLGDPEKTNVELQIKGIEQSIQQIFSQISNKLMTFGHEISDSGREGTGNLGRDLTSMKGDLLKVIREVATTITLASRDSTRDLMEVKQGINAISTKIVGTGIGNVSEKTVIKDLKRAMTNTMDSFSDERASKQGTDIVSTVREKGRDCGRISISVKNTEKWESNFMTQLKKNMREDGSRLGIIATRVLPSEALSEQMYVSPETEEGKTAIVVKLEYVSLAYFALRHVAIHLFETQQILKIKDEETDEAINTFKILVAYINGREFQQGICYIDNAIKDAEATRNHLNQIRAYINTNIDKSVKLQNSVEENLNHARDLIGKLRELLNGSTASLEHK